jgi:hypothetical protein
MFAGGPGVCDLLFHAEGTVNLVRSRTHFQRFY